MKKLLIALAMTVALVGPASAGANDCIGTVMTDKDWVYVVDLGSVADPGGSYTAEGRLCQAPLKSRNARRILATCPVGSLCDVDVYNNDRGGTKVVKKTIELKGRKFDSAETITKIDGVYQK
jgi:hypothetical protein